MCGCFKYSLMQGEGTQKKKSFKSKRIQMEMNAMANISRNEARVATQTKRNCWRTGRQSCTKELFQPSGAR